MQRTRSTHQEEAETVFMLSFKAKVALEAIRGHETVAELAIKHGLHPSRQIIAAWKREAIE